MINQIKDNWITLSFGALLLVQVLLFVSGKHLLASVNTALLLTQAYAVFTDRPKLMWACVAALVVWALIYTAARVV